MGEQGAQPAAKSRDTGTPAMTHEQALAEARKRWGPSGAVETTHSSSGGWCHVGIMETFPMRHFVAKGVGGKWESAFRDADLAARRRQP